eukprot:RCo025384
MPGLNLYVGNMSLAITDELLHRLFVRFGEIQSCKVMTDRVSGESKGFGFVKFSDESNALRAASAMNGVEVDGSTLLVKIADKDQTGAPSVRPSDNLFIRNLPMSFTEQDLNAVFSSFGNIASSIIIRDFRTGQSRGYGLVKFSNIADAATALKKVHGMQLSGSERPLEVKYAEGEDEKLARKGQIRHLYPPGSLQAPYGLAPGPVFRGVPTLSTPPRDSVAAMLSPYSRQAPVPMPPSLPPGVGLGVPPLAGLPLSPALLGVPPRRELQVPAPKDLPPPEDDSNLYIYGLDPAVDELFLYETFAPYGAISSVKVIMDMRLHISKGYGFVRFMKKVDALTALREMDGVVVGDKALQVSIHKPKVSP